MRSSLSDMHWCCMMSPGKGNYVPTYNRHMQKFTYIWYIYPYITIALHNLQICSNLLSRGKGKDERTFYVRRDSHFIISRTPSVLIFSKENSWRRTVQTLKLVPQHKNSLLKSSFMTKVKKLPQLNIHTYIG